MSPARSETNARTKFGPVENTAYAVYFLERRTRMDSRSGGRGLKGGGVPSPLENFFGFQSCLDAK